MGRRHVAQGGTAPHQQSRIALAEDIARRCLQAGQSDRDGGGLPVEKDPRTRAERAGSVHERSAGGHGPVHADQCNGPPAHRRLCRQADPHAAQAQPGLQHAKRRATRRIINRYLQAEGQNTQAWACSTSATKP
jgi:hypothetical protein